MPGVEKSEGSSAHFSPLQYFYMLRISNITEKNATTAKTEKTREADLLFCDYKSRINDIIIAKGKANYSTTWKHKEKFTWIYSMGPKVGHYQKRDIKQAIMIKNVSK